ncbi:hypothetical protein [Azospirillum largimobile]
MPLHDYLPQPEGLPSPFVAVLIPSGFERLIAEFRKLSIQPLGEPKDMGISAKGWV